ncbi:hypothetical protein ACJMK2_001937 [Sinanodonta woodiana]|uniref:J domain-containing protein n=1 Tax=Sinanodonta woodiana TaxID=1069815 RepID=A0ABD3XVE9_SINWO
MAKRSPLHERSQCLNILGLSEGSSEDDIRKAYKKLALQYHPDKNHTEGAKEKFQEIGYAYKFLTEGPDAFETEDHVVPEDFLIRIFEEMFFPNYWSGFGSYFNFMFTDSNDGHYFYYNGSSDDDDDDDYYGLYSGRYSSSGRQYKSTFTEPSRTGHTQNSSSKKKKNKKKRNRNKDYSSTSPRQNTHSKNSEQTGFAQQNTSPSSAKSSAPKVNRENMDAPFTDDVSSVPKETDAGNSTTKMDADQMQNSAENVDRPKQNDPMQQKPSKKQKRKLEAEQFRREKEMEEIAAELLEKQEKERQKQEKEQEKQAAKKQELADADKENDTLYWFEDTKKPRKGRKNERKPTDAEILINTEDEGSSAASDRTTPSDIGQIFTPLVPADDLFDAVPINNQTEHQNNGLCSDENHDSQGAAPVNNKGFQSSGNHQNNQGATPFNNNCMHSNATSINNHKGLYSSGNQNTPGSTSVNNYNYVYSGGNHQHSQGATSVKSGNQHTQVPTSVNNIKGVYSRGKHQHCQGATSVDNKDLYSSGNQHTQGSTSFNDNNGVYSGRKQHAQGSTSFNDNNGVYSGRKQHTHGSTSFNDNSGIYSGGYHQYTQGSTSFNDNNGVYSGRKQHAQGSTLFHGNNGSYSGRKQHTQGSTSFNGNSGLYSSGNHQHTQGSTSFHGNNGVYSGRKQHAQGSTSFHDNNGVYRVVNQHIQGSTSFTGNSGVYSSGKQHTQGSTSVNGNSGIYSGGNHQHTQGSTSVNGNSDVYSGGNHQHTQGSTSVYNNKTQIPSDFNQSSLDSRMSGKLADFKTGSTPETRQQAKNCNQDNILPMHPGFIVTGLPSKRCGGSGSSKTDHGQSVEDANFNNESSNSQPPKTKSKAAEIIGNMNNHHCNQDFLETASDMNSGKGDSISVGGDQTHNKGGNSNVEGNSWYKSIGGPAPSFAAGHMTEPYTRDVQQPEISRKSETKIGDYVQQSGSRKSDTKRGDYVQQSGSRKSDTKRGNYVQQPGSWKSETKRGDYVQQPESRRSDTKRGDYVQQPEISRKSDTKRGDYVQQPESRKSETKAGGYPFSETPHNHNRSYRQHHDQPLNQNRQKFNEFINPGTTDENFNNQTRSKDLISKAENNRKTENQSTATKPQPRNQSNHTGKRAQTDYPVHKSLDSINHIDSEWKSGGKTASKPGSKPSKPFSKEVDDMDSIDDIDPVCIHSDFKQSDPNKEMHNSCISNETKLKLSDFGNSSNEFLCRSKLDVPKSIVSENIKKYYAS